MIEEFLKPTNPKEAVSFKQKYPNALYLSGGTWINSSYSKLNPKTVISLAGLGLNKVEKKSDVLEIGSFVTMQDLIDNKDIPEVLKESARHVGSRNIRNMATLGGSIGAKSPWFSLSPALLVLETILTVHDGEKEKDVLLSEYIEKDYNDLILKLKISSKTKRTAKVLKYTRTARTVPVIVASASYEKEGNNYINPLVAIGGVSNKTVLLKNLSLTNKREEIEKTISSLVNPKGDFRASAKLRKYMAGVLSADCFEGAK